MMIIVVLKKNAASSIGKGPIKNPNDRTELIVHVPEDMAIASAIDI